MRLTRLVNWVHRNTSVLLLTPWTPSFGDCAYHIRYGVMKARRERTRVLLIAHRHELSGWLRMPIANRELFLLESESLYPANSVPGWIAGWLLTAHLAFIRLWNPLWRFQHRLRRLVRPSVLGPDPRQGPSDAGPQMSPLIGVLQLWQPAGMEAFSWEAVTDLDWSGQDRGYRAPKLSEAKRRSAEQLRVEMGIPLSDWFVALHVREGKDFRHRNASITNYVEAIRVITRAGGWVVRLGDASMRRLPDMERVIDYGHSQWKSELMDLYLISACRFYFGTTSGPLDVAQLLGRPAVTVNAAEFAIWGPVRPNDLGILKHVYSARHRRVLSLKEWLEEPFASQCTGYHFDDREYRLIDNSANEIREVVEEFMRPERSSLSDVQRAFNAVRSRAIRRWLDEGEPRDSAEHEDLLTEQCHLASMADAAGALGHRYLEQNWDAVPGWLKEADHL